MVVKAGSLGRRWACVLSLDVVGFSRMMARDDMSAVEVLRECRLVVESHTSRCAGRLFGSAGDSFMAEFPAEDAAVTCAGAIQQAMASRNKAASESRQIFLRAGIDAGRVIDDDGNLYGDVVNIAARLQEVCASGGVLISGNVATALKEKFDLRSSGELSLKNIPTPVAMFELMDGDRPLGASGVDLAAIDLTRPVPGVEGAAVLAVLPLENETGRPDQEHVCRGLADDLINLFVRMRQFTVIDRNSTFTLTAANPGAAALGRRLGVRYLLEGALEAGEGTMPVAMRLTDLEQGRQIWSDRYTLDADHLAPALDTVARRVCATLGGRIEQAEAARFRGRRESRVGVRGLLWRSRWHLDQLTTRDAEEALRLLRDAQTQDPDNPEVLIQLAHWHWVDAWSMRRSGQALSDLRDMTRRACVADPEDGRGHLLVGVVEILLRNLDDAQEHLETAVVLNPSLAMAHAQIGSCYNLRSEYAKAIPQLELSLRLSPQDYYVFYVHGELAISHCLLSDWPRAIAHARKALALRPSYWNARMSEIAALAHSGDLEAAALSFQTLMFRTPKFSQRYLDWLPYQESSVKAFFAEAIERARKFSTTMS